MPVHDRISFESLYTGQPRWEIGRPQKLLLDVADRITGSVLDAGFGTGENALFFDSWGQKVTGIDFMAEPINLAKQKAAERGLTASAPSTLNFGVGVTGLTEKPGSPTAIQPQN